MKQLIQSTLLAALAASMSPALFAQGEGGPVGGGGTRVVTRADGTAPEQPDGRSSASFRKTTRVNVPGVVDNLGRISAKIRNLVGVRGMEDNYVSGFGLVTGLNATGDSGQLAAQMLANGLLGNQLNIDPGLLSTANVAVVLVEGTIPAGTKPGQRIDIRVSSIGDATTLQGGLLTETRLLGPDRQLLYATASGPLTIGGFTAGGEGATTTKNHVTVGTLAEGGKVEREIPTSVVTEHGYVYLDTRVSQTSLGNTNRIAEKINGLYPGYAQALPDARSIRVAVPTDLPEHQYVAFVDSMLELEIATDNLARVVVNERTGVIVMGGDVRLRPGVIQHSSIVLSVAETPEASQPAGFSGGETVVLPRTEVDVTEGDAPLIQVGGAVSLDQVVNVLNVLGATPRDMIAILESLVESGLLIAELRRI